MVRAELDDPAGAAAAYSEALAADPALSGAILSPVDARKRLTRALLQLREPDGALSALAPLFDSGADRETAWLLSRVRLQSGDLPAAIASLRRGSQYLIDRKAPEEPAPYVGASRCKACHAEIYELQQRSHHATTFLAGASVGALEPPAGIEQDPRAADVRHYIVRDELGIRFETERGEQRATARAAYAFGSGDRGATLVGQDATGQWRELRLSRYGDATGWDLTTGHPNEPPDAGSAGAYGYLGRALDADNLRRCLECHTTNLRAARDPEFPTAADHGIGCERCHGPGGNHLLAINAAPDFPETAIGMTNASSNAEVTAACARCHSPRGMEVSPDDPTSIRFQGTTLGWSRCFRESQGALGCVSCHDPHSDAETSATYYDAKCLTCHGDAPGSKHAVKDGARPIRPSAEMRRVACPVDATGGCVECHMPTRAGVIPHTSFADHWIRVHPYRTAR
jgi:hypothetical protein